MLFLLLRSGSKASMHSPEPPTKRGLFEHAHHSCILPPMRSGDESTKSNGDRRWEDGVANPLLLRTPFAETRLLLGGFFHAGEWMFLRSLFQCKIVFPLGYFFRLFFFVLADKKFPLEKFIVMFKSLQSTWKNIFMNWDFFFRLEYLKFQ